MASLQARAAATRRDVRLSKRILLATDLSAGSDQVAAGAVKLAAEIGAEIVSMHVVTEHAMTEHRAELPADQSFVDVVETQISQNLTKQTSRVLEGRVVHVTPKVVEGKRAKEIIRELNGEDYAYAVVGVRNRSRVGKLLLGSVSQQILLHSHCPVLAIPVRT